VGRAKGASPAGARAPSEARKTAATFGKRRPSSKPPSKRTQFHPLADLFPLLEGAATAVAQQIAEHGAVYLIGTKRGGVVKIGHAVDVYRRLKDLRTGFPGGAIYVLSFIPGSNRIEAGLHELFSDLRINGEWFNDREMEISSTFEELLQQFCDGRASLAMDMEGDR
jgi:hypothetical protein